MTILWFYVVIVQALIWKEVISNVRGKFGQRHRAFKSWSLRPEPSVRCWVFWRRAAKEEVMGGSIDSAPADWLKGPAGFVCVWPEHLQR